MKNKIPTWALSNRPILKILQNKNKIKVAALTGPIASGKSSAANFFCALGANLIDFDLLAREVTEKGSPQLKEIAQQFGDNLISPDGKLDRAKTAQLIFNDLNAKKLLEDILHPAIWQKMADQLKTYSTGLTIIAIPLLFEVGLEQLFKNIILIDIDKKNQLDRLLSRNKELGMPLAQKIINSQLDNNLKTPYVNYIIKNNGTFEDLKLQVSAIYPKLIFN